MDICECDILADDYNLFISVVCIALNAVFIQNRTEEEICLAVCILGRPLRHNSSTCSGSIKCCSRSSISIMI